jgi:hypothetical protein
MVASFFDQASVYLDDEERHKKPNELRPKAKAQCYLFLATVLHMAHPHPIEPNWFHFGFCTCRDERDERGLGGLYQNLLIGDKLFEDTRRASSFPAHLKSQTATATFTEFWRAYESGRLIQLMDSKGLKNERPRVPFLETFLSVPPSGPHPRVWSLKQFLEIDNPVDRPAIPGIQVDYSFRNCRDFEETCILSEVYKRLLSKADPLELHEACLAGRSFEFAERFHRMDVKHRRLMRNPYHLAE